MKTLKWLLGGAALAWVVGGFVHRAGLATRIFPFLPNPGSPAANEMFHVEPIERHDPPPTPHTASGGVPDDQQHVNASYELEHGHPKR